MLTNTEAVRLSDYYTKTDISTFSKEDISKLSEVIEHHKELYYADDMPIISDKQYDELFDILKVLEEKFGIQDIASPTQTVGGFKEQQFTKKQHLTPMISLDNTYNADDLRSFEKRIRNILKDDTIPLSYHSELKFDGLWVSLTYENGKLIQGITRGNGIIGEDVTVNVLQIKNIPHTIPYTDRLIEIRGEVVMPIASFQGLNADRAVKGEKLFSNPRNAASGSLRQLDESITAQRGLVFFAYNAPVFEDLSVESVQDYGQYIYTLQSWWFSISPYFEFHKNIEDIITKIESMDGKPSFPFEIDGLVVKVHDLALWETLGTTSHHPRYSISYKFPAEYERSKVLSVEHSLGRTGIVTPVVNLEPVIIGGVTVKRATLHNYDEAKNKDVHIGDHVFITRAGEVIPEVVSVISELRDGSEKEILPPKSCPACGTELIQEGEKIAYLCPNKKGCPAQIHGQLEWFVGRSGMDIDGFGDKQVELFLSKGWITDYASVFELHRYADEILALEGYQEKSVQNLMQAIEKACTVPVSRLLSALGISGVGKKTGKILAYLFQEKQDFYELPYTVEQLEEIKDIGPETASNIVQYFYNNTDTIRRLVDQLDIVYEKPKATWGVLAGKSFVITGSFEWYSRDELAKIIEEHGGDFKTSISKNTSYLLAGEKAGSKKAKAENLGVAILSLEAFFKIIK